MITKVKKFSIAFAMALTTYTAYAGNELTVYQLPGPVLKAFRKDYPAAANPKFEEDKEKEVRVFVIEFEFEGKDHRAFYLGNGKILKIERDDE